MGHLARLLSARLRDKRGNSAVEFVMTTAMLILVMAVLISALVYVTQYYSASYICRRVVRQIETTGEYDERSVRDLADGLGGTALDGLSITVHATYCDGHRIQLLDQFDVDLHARHRINVLTLGAALVSIDLPIDITLSGRSEVFWR